MATPDPSIQALRQHVKNKLRLFGVIDEYINAHDDVSAELKNWQQMFRSSLDNYRDLCDMPLREWNALTLAELVKLDTMIGNATLGLLLWLLPDDLVSAIRPFAS